MNTPQERPIELRAPDVEEVLSRPPSWLVRWGSGLMGLIIVGLLIGTYLIRFPEYVNATAVVTTGQPPLWLLARTGSRIQQLRVEPLATVSKGQVIAVLENPANADDVAHLKTYLTDSSLYEPDSLSPDQAPFNRSWQLGDLQTTWSNVVNRWTDYYVSQCMDNHGDRWLVLKREVGLLNINQKGLKRQIDHQSRQCALDRERLERDRTLLKQGLVAEETVQASEQALLNNLQTLETLQQSLNSLTADNLTLQQQLREEASQRQQILATKRQTYLMAVNEWRAAIESWECTYMIVSPTDGILTYPCARSLHQPVSLGERLFAVVPIQPGPPVVQLTYGKDGQGKVKPGQTVRVFLDGYPYLEYGTLGAMVSQTALMPDEKALFTATALLPEGLKTNYDETIGLKGELTGHARIEVNNQRLIQRMIAPLKYLTVAQSQPSSTSSIMVEEPPLYSTPAPPNDLETGTTACRKTAE